MLLNITNINNILLKAFYKKSYTVRATFLNVLSWKKKNYDEFARKMLVKLTSYPTKAAQSTSDNIHPQNTLNLLKFTIHFHFIVFTKLINLVTFS